MAALSPTVLVYKAPHGRDFLTVVSVAVTSSGGHLPKEALGFARCTAVLGQSCSTSAVAAQVFPNSQNGTDPSNGDVWVDSAGNSTYTIALLGR